MHLGLEQRAVPPFLPARGAKGIDTLGEKWRDASATLLSTLFWSNLVDTR